MKNTIEIVKKNKLIAIIRGVKKDKVADTAKALYDGGIRLMEVTFNQSSPTCEQDTHDAIKAITDAMGDKVCVGAGTVMTEKQVEVAVEAGAKYIISPNTDFSVIKKSNELGVLSMPGAFTPSEIADAYKAGADFVKVFPAGTLGVSYIRAVRSPISHIPLLAVGGVNENNLLDFFKAGVCGVGIGSNLVNCSLIENGEFSELTKLAKTYTEKLQYL